MSAQFKLDQKPTLSEDKKNFRDKKIGIRPNIDHLLKRINLERKQERTNTRILLVLAVIAISTFSYIFSA